MTETEIWFKNVRFFRPEEFGPKPGAVSRHLILALDILREISKTPILIHCSYDTSGHSTNSYHYKGIAADFHFAHGLTPLEQYCYISMVPGLNGIGWYPDWNNPGWHVDLRPQPLRWTRRKGEYLYDIPTFAASL